MTRRRGTEDCLTGDVDAEPLFPRRRNRRGGVADSNVAGGAAGGLAGG